MSIELLILLTLLLAPGPGPQQPKAETAPTAPQPESVTIRAQAAEVLVDAVVTDRRNRLVTTLKPEDFIVYEDGVEQRISSFRLASERPAAAKPEPSEPAPPAPEAPKPAPEASPPQFQNLTVLLLDYSTTQFQNQKLVQDAAVRYVNERLRPNDLMAVFVLGTSLRFLSDFTDDKETLLAALRSRDVTGSALAAERGSLSSGIAAARATRPAATTPAAGLSGPGAAASGASMGATGPGRAAAMMAARIEAQFIALQSALDQRMTRAVLTAIRAIAIGVGHIEGRKNLILFSQGFVVGEALEDQLQAVVDVANRARLAIYSIDARGLETRELSSDIVPKDELTALIDKPQRDRMAAVGGETVFDRALQVGRDMEESALRYVSNATGGFLIRNTNDLALGLDRVDEEMRGYYLLSYRPSNPGYDGRFRQIRVEVRQPGLSVRARTGYYAIPAGYEFLSPEEYQVLQAARAAGSTTPLFLRAGGFLHEENRYRVPVVLEVPARSIRFEKSGNIFIAKLQVVGLVRDAEGEMVSRFGGRLQYSASEAEYRMLLPGNVSVLNTLELGPGNYSVELAIKDTASGAAAFRREWLYLREHHPQLALSTVLLAKQVDKADGGAEQFLSVGGVKILPLAQCEYRNGENLIFYFDIYDPQLRADKKADVTVNLWLTRNGQRLKIGLPEYSLTDAAAGPVPHMTLARFVRLAGLDPGDYSLVVQVKDRLANRTEMAQAPFVVVE
ncbi:MAG: VWA domain-containing protein [Acidobacteria bacterium]|nr:VWA domain-containing protein [Acidobacteriota bacterium]